MAGPLAAGFGQLIGDSYPRASAGVWADEQGGAPLCGAERRVQAGAALEGFLCDDGCVVPLCPTHGAFDSRRPVLVGAVLAAPLQAQICHPRSGRSPQLITPPTLPPASSPFFSCVRPLAVTASPVSPVFALHTSVCKHCRSRLRPSANRTSVLPKPNPIGSKSSSAPTIYRDSRDILRPNTHVIPLLPLKPLTPPRSSDQSGF